MKAALISSAMAIVAVCGITTLADAQTAKVNGACPSGLITCEEWCKHYRPLNLQDCLENHPRSCKAQFSKIGGKEACLPDRPPTSF